MPTPIRTRALQWALVWALAVAVMGMHHLGTHDESTHPMTAVTSTAHVDCCDLVAAEAGEHRSSPSGHDMSHACLAVLCAALGLGLLLIALRRRATGELFRSFLTGTTRPRSPPPRPRGAPALLASLCVLRL